MSSKHPAVEKSIHKSTKPTFFDAIIFDIDNVLIDTNASYLEAIRWTVDLYLTHGKIPFFQKGAKASSPQIISPEDVDRFKLLGGFNDDWDCCYGLLVYLLSLPAKPKTVDALKAVLNTKAFAKSIHENPFGVRGVVKKLGVSPHVRIEKIGRIFQEVYLGKELFQKVENLRPSYWKKRGLIYKEKLVFKAPMLDKLKERGIKLGIATGRPRFEALFTLKHFGILHYFDAITAMDEVKKAEKEQKVSLRKPHPFSIIETAKKLGMEHRFAYIGDLPDDMLAAHAARKQHVDIHPVAFPFLSRDTETIEQIKKTEPSFILKKPADVISVALSGRVSS